MESLTQLDKVISNAQEKRKNMERASRSPWSSTGSTCGSTSPLPAGNSNSGGKKYNPFEKSLSGSSIGSGSSPGTNECKTFLTGQASLTVPEVNLPAGKVTRSTSPFSFKRITGDKKDKKKLEKQSKALDEGPSPLMSLSSASSIGTSFENNGEAAASATSEAATSTSTSPKPTSSNPFKEFRKKRKENPFSLNLMRKKSSEKEIPCTANSLHPDSSFGGSGELFLGTSPPGSASGWRSSSRSPPSPNSGCKCRRCSILHLEECEPKEMSALFKFLRKSKVNFVQSVVVLAASINILTVLTPIYKKREFIMKMDLALMAPCRDE